MPARSILEIILRLKGDQARKELSKVDKEFNKVEKSAKESSKGIEGFQKDLLKMGAVIGGVTAGIIATGKALYDLGKRGAIVDQTQQSFDGLLKQWSLAPNLLDELRKASRGTVDDMTLMSSTLTLVAGTSQELGEEMLKNSPRLLEIAKAANKLNPALGDTAFLYESITAGIKRNSKLVLDNLGIVFSQETAYREYAEAIGKSTDELTDNERALATLNKVVNDAGQNLLDQAGGIESATDAMAEMEAKTANLKDELARLAYPTISKVVVLFSDLTDVLLESKDALDQTTIAGESLSSLLLQGAIGVGPFIEAFDQLNRALEAYERFKAGDVTRELLDFFPRGSNIYPFIESLLASQELEKIDSKLLHLANSQDIVADSSDNLSSKSARIIEAFRLQRREADELAISEEEAARAAEEFAKRMDRLASQQIETLNRLREQKAIKIEDFFDVDMGVGDLAARLFDITQFKEFGGEALSIMVEEVKAGLVEGKITNEEAKEFWKNIAIEAAAIEIKMGEIDLSEAAEKISEDFNEPIGETRKLLEKVLDGFDLINSADISAITEEFDALQERKATLMEIGEIPLEADPEESAKLKLEGIQEQIDFLTGTQWEIDLELYADAAFQKLSAFETKLKNLQLIYDFERNKPEPPSGGGYPQRQHGGSVFSNMPYLVGERGPELFVPGQSGNIVPNGGAGGYTQIVNQHFYDEGAAALGMAVVREGGRARLNASMGR